MVTEDQAWSNRKKLRELAELVHTELVELRKGEGMTTDKLSNALVICELEMTQHEWARRDREGSITLAAKRVIECVVESLTRRDLRLVATYTLNITGRSGNLTERLSDAQRDLNNETDHTIGKLRDAAYLEIAEILAGNSKSPCTGQGLDSNLKILLTVNMAKSPQLLRLLTQDHDKEALGIHAIEILEMLPDGLYSMELSMVDVSVMDTDFRLEVLRRLIDRVLRHSWIDPEVEAHHGLLPPHLVRQYFVQHPPVSEWFTGSDEDFAELFYETARYIAERYPYETSLIDESGGLTPDYYRIKSASLMQLASALSRVEAEDEWRDLARRVEEQRAASSANIGKLLEGDERTQLAGANAEEEEEE